MKKLICSIVALCMIFSAMSFGVSAAGFKDMPDNWSTEALEKAVENGLLTGYDDNTIRPSDNVTRSQMATIMVRAFGATREADISEFADVKADAWYYTYMAAAVEMGIFKGDGSNLNPDNNITRQEAFVVLARAFSLEEGKASALRDFKDKNTVADWAVPSVAAIVSNGYAKGDTAGNLNPTNNITRAEFAVLMNNIVKQYITKSGTYEADDIANGNILVRANNVTIKKAEITGNLIIGYNVKNGAVTLDSTVVKGYVINDESGVKVVTKDTSSAPDFYIPGSSGNSGNSGNNNDNQGGIEDGGDQGGSGDIGTGDDGSGNQGGNSGNSGNSGNQGGSNDNGSENDGGGIEDGGEI